jgi:hypothetical protein
MVHSSFSASAVSWPSRRKIHDQLFLPGDARLAVADVVIGLVEVYLLFGDS